MSTHSIDNPHPSVTLDRLEPLMRESLFGDSSPGICVACGADADGCEPDARKYKCEECGERQVYGAEWVYVGLA